ncbi:hypothetical protein JL09_g7104 [Pichia kudriavzevii]|uniref:Uncharacterized protein n=1 Tax=Pichia kudriavzevii TaxID=4909 RepID=A0A099NJK2_PICKU|nr:hypothetical protein JL09_g7104 [Pichia kudriavzevii]
MASFKDTLKVLSKRWDKRSMIGFSLNQ